MKRDDIVIEIQARLNLITVGNGHPFDVDYIFRNPDEEPSPEQMPAINIFEMPDITTGGQQRKASDLPVYERQFTVALELWYKSVNPGIVSKDIMTFLKASRQVIFSDGVTLGGLVSMVLEEETSRVFRPDIKNNVVGIGQVLQFTYIEDFSNL